MPYFRTLVVISALTIAACSSGGGSTPTPVAADTVLTGTVDPTAEGWVAETNITSATTTSNGSEVEIDTIGATSSDTSPRLLYVRDVGLADGVAVNIEWRMRVVDSDPHNQFDAEVVFMPRISALPFGAAVDRSQMIYFDNDGIGWADGSESHAMDTTDGFHEYELRVDADGNAMLFVDGTLALSRAGMALGSLAFGDHTNDSNVDGHFILDYIRIRHP